MNNVPNVSTNDQTPIYNIPTEIAELSSKEKLSVAFGKIARAIKELISHLSNNTKHITTSERTAWNSKVDGSHTHGHIINSTAKILLTPSPSFSGNFPKARFQPHVTTIMTTFPSDSAKHLQTFAANGVEKTELLLPVT